MTMYHLLGSYCQMFALTNWATLVDYRMKYETTPEIYLQNHFHKNGKILILILNKKFQP